jgi:hypothetical protein
MVRDISELITCPEVEEDFRAATNSLILTRGGLNGLFQEGKNRKLWTLSMSLFFQNLTWL